MTGNKKEADRNMASRMKELGIERENGKCPTCNQYMPNGTFYPAAAYAHILSCKGPAKRKGSNGAATH